MPQLSVVVPVFNERDNVKPLIDEIVAALRGRQDFEIVYVDDCSKDDSLAVLRDLRPAVPELRIIKHISQSGQSTAVRNGVKAARGTWIATLDGDGQNDPADLPHMLDEARRLGVDCVTGVRAKRQDNFIRKLSSRVGNGFRNWATGDRVSDSGCGVRVVRAACVRELPVFNGLHRFMPTLLRTKGYSVAERPVNHRPRLRGVSKYGVHNRLWRGIRDCFGVRWFAARAVPAERVDGGTEQGQGR